jgi:hypothetical protein
VVTHLNYGLKMMMLEVNVSTNKETRRGVFSRDEMPSQKHWATSSAQSSNIICLLQLRRNHHKQVVLADTILFNKKGER